MEQCGTIFIRRDFKDDSGCLKPNGHNDHHVCRTESGELMAWQDDEECTCGCWNDEDDLNNVCKIYWKVKSITMDKIQELAETYAEDHCETIRDVKEYNNYCDLANVFMAAMELQLPVLFAQWKDSICIEKFISLKRENKFPLFRRSYSIGHFDDTAYSLEELYTYWFANIYSPNQQNAEV